MPLLNALYSRDKRGGAWLIMATVAIFGQHYKLKVRVQISRLLACS